MSTMVSFNMLLCLALNNLLNYIYHVGNVIKACELVEADCEMSQ